MAHSSQELEAAWCAMAIRWHTENWREHAQAAKEDEEHQLSHSAEVQVWHCQSYVHMNLSLQGQLEVQEQTLSMEQSC